MNNALTNGFKIIPNPDFIHRKKVEEAIKENDGYCCCALEKTDDTKCMCKKFREQQHYGFCDCGRYYKVLSAPIVCLNSGLKYEGLNNSINSVKTKGKKSKKHVCCNG